METRKKIRRIGSFVFGGIFLFLAIMGDAWRTTDAAVLSLEPTLYIDYILPSSVFAGSPDRFMIISGGNFGYDHRLIGVWFLGAQQTAIISPIDIMDHGLSLVVSDTLMTDPTIYQVSVIKGHIGPIPTIPPDPTDAFISNPVPFTVLEGNRTYLPFITNR